MGGKAVGGEGAERGDADRAVETAPPKTERGEEQRKEGTVRRGAGGTGTEVSDVCVCVCVRGAGCQQSPTRRTDRRHGGGGRMPPEGLSPP